MFCDSIQIKIFITFIPVVDTLSFEAYLLVTKQVKIPLTEAISACSVQFDLIMSIIIMRIICSEHWEHVESMLLIGWHLK